MNFFGQNYSSAWPSIDGGIFFANPDDFAKKTMPNLISSANSSAMFPFGVDLEFDPTISNLWTAQTTVDSHAAVIFSWEHFLDPNNGSSDVSFQLVLLDLSNGDFNAYFNFDTISGLSQNNGYPGPAVLIDLANGVSVGSNIATTSDAKYLPTGCLTAADATWLGSGSNGVQDPFNSVSSGSAPWAYFKKESATTISLWKDSSCTDDPTNNHEPLLIDHLQDTVTNGAYYVELMPDQNSTPPRSVAIGWGTFNATTKVIDWTELQRNVDLATLVDGQPNALVTQKLNTTVPGRYVIGQRSGRTFSDAATITPRSGNSGGGGSSNSGSSSSSAPTEATPTVLAETGSPTWPVMLLGVLLLSVGAGLMTIRRKN